mmetsp:Transcript_87057/g.251139  ORF Transcript_87057/g.251139 Transcript_87057/m.251139 type:complete len:201 (-) Transcript_87057:17-619(-)
MAVTPPWAQLPRRCTFRRVLRGAQVMLMVVLIMVPYPALIAYALLRVREPAVLAYICLCYFVLPLLVVGAMRALSSRMCAFARQGDPEASSAEVVAASLPLRRLRHFEAACPATVFEATKPQSAEADESSASDTCCICLEAKVAGQSRRVLKCGHEFHTQCVDGWWLRNTVAGVSLVCPMCRRPTCPPTRVVIRRRRVAS